MTIQIRRSSVDGVVPDPALLAVGELAVNTANAKLWTKHTDGSLKDLSSSNGLEALGQMHDWFERQFNIQTASTTVGANKRLSICNNGDSLSSRCSGYINHFFQRGLGSIKDGGFQGNGALVSQPTSFIASSGPFPGISGDVDPMTSQFNIWMNGSYYNVGPGGSVKWASSNAITLAEIRAYFIKEPGAATFVIETSDNNSTWTQQGAVEDASNATQIGAVAKRTFTEQKVWVRVRNTHASARLKLIGAYTGYDSSVAGFDGMNIQAGGISPTQYCTTPSAIYTPILTDLNPALMTFQFDDVLSEFSTNWTALMNIARAGNDNRSVLFIANGPRLVDGDNAMSAVTSFLRSRVDSDNIAVFDMMEAIGPWSRLVAQGWEGDGIHVNDRAYAYAASILMDRLGMRSMFDPVVTDVVNPAVKTDRLTVGRPFAIPPFDIVPEMSAGTGAAIRFRRDLEFKDTQYDSLFFRFTTNQAVRTNILPDCHYRANIAGAGLPTPKYAEETAGLTEWVYNNRFWLRSESASKDILGIGPFINRVNVTFPAIAAGVEQTFTATVNGVVVPVSDTTGWNVNITWTNPLPVDVYVKQAWVSGTNQVTFVVANKSTGSVTPSANVATITCFQNSGAAGSSATATTTALGGSLGGGSGSSLTVSEVDGTPSSIVTQIVFPNGTVSIGSGVATVTGLQGSPGSAATISVGTVTTGAAGSSVIVTNSGTSSAAVFDITIPRGNTGSAGGTGATGSAGPAADMTRTSTSSNTIGTGSKTFAYTSSSNLGWAVGTRLRAANSSVNYMEGVITAVSSTSVNINVDLIAGAGTPTSWNIGIAGDQGTAGGGGSSIDDCIPFSGSGITNVYLTRPFSGSATTVALSANRLNHVPFRITKTRIFTKIAVTVTTAVASSRIYLGIRNMDQNTGQPTIEILDCGSVDSSSTGVKEITFGSPLTLTPGLYYFDVWSPLNPTISGANNPENILGVQMTGTTSVIITQVFRNSVTGIDTGGMPTDVSGDTYGLHGVGTVTAMLVGIR